MAHAAGPLAAAAVVAFAAWAAVPHTAWLPWVAGQQPSEAWQALLHWPQGWLADMQIAIAARIGPGGVIGAAIGVAAACAALATLALAAALRAAALTRPLAALVAILAAAGPILAWQAGSPLGAAPATLASALLLWCVTRSRVRGHVTWFPLGATLAAGAVLLIVVTGALATHWFGAWPAGDTWGLVRGDVGLAGLVLLLPAFGGIAAPSVPRERVLVVALVLWLATTPLPPAMRAAVLLPWVWWFIGVGLARLIDWRGARASRWALVGLVIWIGISAGRTPWGRQHQQAALVRTWAEGIAGRVDAAHPLAPEPSAQGLLVGTLADARTGPSDGTGRDAPPIPGVVASGTRVDALRWTGFAVDDIPPPVGVPLERVLDALPRGTVVLAAISREAAGALTAAQWQALARSGLRLATAGTPRAHALAGVAQSRVEALERRHPEAARLDVQPGDPLGRTDTLSPVDARVDAGARRVAIALRGRPVVEGEGLALVFFTARGDFLGWRGGTLPSYLDGPPLGRGPRGHGMVVGRLPCLDVAAGAPANLAPLAQAGALGIAWSAPGEVRLRAARPPGVPDTPLRLASGSVEGAAPTLSRLRADDYLLVRSEGQDDVSGLWLRGPLADATASATVDVRVCAAWPVASAIDPSGGRVEMPVRPGFDGMYGTGWHDVESAEGGYFRWMNGTHAAVAIAIRRVAPIRVTVDVRPPIAPRAGDSIGLVVNGEALEARPLGPTRQAYTWDLPAASLRAGLNHVMLETTLTFRPADATPGADARTLGLLVHDWIFEPERPTSTGGR